MTRRISQHLRTNVVGYIALFIALSGTAYAAVATNSVKSKHIVDGQVKSADVQDDGLTGVDIDEASLGSVPFAEESNTANSAQSAGNADLLDGMNSTEFLGAIAKAADSDLLDGLNSTAFLGSNAKAADSDKLDNLDSSAFVQKQGATFTDVLPSVAGGNCASVPPNQWYDIAVDRQLAYYRDPFGIVHLQGGYFRCGTPPVAPLNLPAGFRPAIASTFAVAAGGSLDSVETFSIFPNGQGVGQGLAGFAATLDGITFRCGPSGENGCL